MANNNAPFGLRPVRTLGGVYTGAVNPYQVADNYDVTANSGIFTGDPVIAVTGGTVELSGAAPTVDSLGVFTGCNYVDPASGTPTWKAYYPDTTNITVGIIEAYIIDDPMVVFEIQVEGIVLQTSIFANFTYTNTDGDTKSGRSRFELDFASLATTGTDPLKIIGISQDVENKDLTVTDANVYVILNQHILKSVGVAGLAG